MLELSEGRRRAILLGMLVGDALGVPYEFHDTIDLPAPQRIDFEPPAGFRRSHGGVPAGTWSDDGAQNLALLDSLRQQPELDLKHFCDCMLAWYSNGRYTPDGRVFDIGIQTSTALRRLACGVPPERSGPSGVENNGNGSLMRALSCLLVPFDSAAALVQRALRQSLPTHAHPRSQVCCALLVLTGWHLANGREPEHALSASISLLEEHFEARPDLLGELRFVLSQRPKQVRASGYVVDSFWSAWEALTSNTDYTSCVRYAVWLGNDTDTTACIAGGLAGARWGEESLRSEWVQSLRGRELALSFLT